MHPSLRLPALCRLCNQYHRDRHAICDACTQLIEPLGPACDHCATPLSPHAPRVCGACGIQPPILDRVITQYRFSEPLRTLIHAYKYEKALYLTSFLAELMLETQSQHHTSECLVPIPLHKTRLQQRGFNQATVLTLYLSQRLNKPYDLYGCDKILPTLAQAGLNAKQRSNNLKNAFKTRQMPYDHVTLVDDLYTTGATANEVAKTLKQQGVQQVDLWCCARACPQYHPKL